jgi:hypothetical protein
MGAANLSDADQSDLQLGKTAQLLQISRTSIRNRVNFAARP